MSRGDLSEAEWRLLKDLLPAERGRKSRPAHDNRPIVNGILWRIRTGAPWRDVPEKYGKWMTVYQRFRRWSESGVWEVVATTLAQAMAVRASYLPQGGIREPSDYTPELSRRGRGVEVWAALLSLGHNGLAELVERNCRQARRFAAGLSAAGFEVLNEVALNQVLVSFGAPERTERVILALQEDGTCWCGGTLWQGRTAMRISVCCWATRDDDVEKSNASAKQASRDERSSS